VLVAPGLPTYDAEYVALARLLGCRLFTVDERLRRGAGRLVEVVGPREL
jgi:predicted nucleic acid-binding protein